MAESVNRGSAYLRSIHEQQGRDPTPEEMHEAHNMVRRDQGLEDAPFNPVTPQTSEFGQRVMASANSPGMSREQLRAFVDSFGGQQDLPLANNKKQVNLPTLPPMPQYVSEMYAANAAQRDAILKGHIDDLPLDEEEYRQGVDTVEDELLSVLEERYNEEFIDQGVLNNLEGMTDEEKVQRITSEYMRSNANKEHTRNLLALNLLRQGFGGMPVDKLDEIWMQLTPAQAEGLWQQYASNQRRQYNIIIDQIAAQQGEGFTTGAALGEIIKQDIAPFYGAITRVLGTNKFLPHDVEIGLLRKGLPGEVRQEIREWWVNASHEDRIQWLNTLKSTWDSIRKGPNSGFYTRYLVVENLLGTFTDDLIYSEDPTDSLDRVFGNLDTALGAVIAGGLFVKRGKSIFSMFKGGDANLAKQAAAAGGSREAQEALDASIARIAEKHGISVDEAQVPHLTKPKQMELDLGTTVETDTVKHTVTPNDLRRQRIMEYLDTADTEILTAADKAAAADRILDELDALDNVHVMHKMSSVRGLPNGTGIEFTITIGSRTGEGWMDVGELIDDVVGLDPSDTFRIMRRGPDGVLEELPVTVTEIADFKATGRIPESLKDYIDMTPEAKEFDRFFGGRPIHRVSMAELQAAMDNGWIPLNSPMYDWVREEIRLRNAKGVESLDPDPMLTLDGDELFVQIEKTHFYEAGDIQDLDVFRLFENPQKTNFFDLSWAPSWLFPPNTKFDRLYEAARRTYHMEEASLAEFADILRPFDGLNAKQKQGVGRIIEYVEDYSKDLQHATGQAGVPSASHLRRVFPGFDDATWEGYHALREAMDGVYDVLNRRLYRDFNNRGAVTIRGVGSDNLPNFHGIKLADSDIRAGKYYDPVKRELVEFTQEELDDLVSNGGAAIKLDFPIDAPQGGKFDVVIARPSEYRVGKLSDRVLNYYEGYHFRFYEDPYFIVKRTYDPKINGRAATKADGFDVDPNGRVFYDEAVRTAGSHEEAFRFINRGKATRFDNGRGEYVRTDGKGAVFVIKPARQINVTEGTLYQKQALHREGRIFWDERSRRRLPDTTGNRAKISDPTYAMTKGLAMAMRQSTQEGLFKALKVGFEREFGDLPHFWKNRSKLKSDQLDELEKDLQKGRNEASGQTRARYNRAIEIVRYMRTQMGTDAAFVPKLRQATINAAVILERFLGPKSSKPLGAIQRWGLSMDPFATGRKVAYGAFMVLRPARQLLLQSAQISMLTGLTPRYIGSGKIFLDAFALRRGLSRYRWAGFDDGWSDAKIAKAMGLSKKEYKRLVEEFQRSGLMGSVNTHSFNANSKNLQAQLPENAGKWDRFSYSARVKGRGVYNFLAKGFELGEQNNLTFSYLVALKRLRKREDIKDLTKMSREQWNRVASEADSLALAMTRPNKLAYQSGYTGMLFQFMSFQHRALMTLLGMNPKLSRADTAKLATGMMFLWGANTAGMENWARETMAASGMSHLTSKEIIPGITIEDLIAAGFIETGFNAMGRALSDEYKDLNLGILAPGAAVVEIYKQVYELVSTAPAESMAFLGPVSNQASGFIKGLRFVQGEANNPTRTPGEKFLRASDYMLRQVLPQYNDANRVWAAYQLEEWIDKDGDKQGMQPVIQTLISRGLLGIRSKEEMSRYRMRTLHWENQQNIDNWVDAWKPYMKEIVVKWRDGEYSDDKAYELAAVAHNLTESAPEGVRREIYNRLMTEPDTTGQSVIDLIIESMPTSDLKKYIPHVQNQTDMTAEEKQWVVDYLTRTADGYEQLDEQHRQLIEHDLKAKGIE